MLAASKSQHHLHKIVFEMPRKPVENAKVHFQYVNPNHDTNTNNDRLLLKS